jgi:peptide/nickel transport system permease protein
VQAMLAIGVLLAPGFFRVIRSATMHLGRAQYVEAAELLGASTWQLLRVHVVRKVVPTVAVTVASSAAMAMLTVSSLTFLGIGVQPPNPTWGGVLSSDLAYLNQSAWAPLAPIVLIALTVGAFNGLVDSIRYSTQEGKLRDDDQRSGA